MSFKPIQIVVGDAAGKPLKNTTLLGMYAEELEKLPPSREVNVEDPEYDVETLNSSLSFRVAILGDGDSSQYEDVEITWDQPERHKLDPTGKFWEKGDGVGVRYPIADDSGGTYYICIQFKP